MILFDTLRSGNAWKVRLLLRNLGLAFERKTLDLAKGDTKTPEYLAMSPRGQVPVMQFDDGTTLAQSPAILARIAEDTEYFPTDPVVRGKVMEWMFFEQCDLLKPLAIPRFIVALAGQGEEKADLVKQFQDQGYPMLALMDKRLAASDFLVDDYSIADINLYPYTSMAHLGNYDMDRFPAIQAWIKRVESLPGWVPLIED